MSQGGSQTIGTGPALTDLQAYWSNHHPGTLPAGVTTRWQIYQVRGRRDRKRGNMVDGHSGTPWTGMRPCQYR